MNQLLAEFVWKRAQHRCEYCLLPSSLSVLPFQIDHVIALKHGGETDAANLALSCERCNSHKGPNIAGHHGGVHVRLFHPRLDQWTEHFEWRGPVLLGLTPIAIVTIDVLSINQKERVAVRQVLIEEGDWSPDA